MPTTAIHFGLNISQESILKDTLKGEIWIRMSAK